jgi:hypothetical protein
MGVENFPQVFFDQFDNSQGWESLEGETAAQDSQASPPELEEEVILALRAEVGRVMITNLNRVDLESLPTEEAVKAEYYKFNIAVSYVGIISPGNWFIRSFRAKSQNTKPGGAIKQNCRGCT